MKENTSFLKAACKAAWLPALLPALGLVASALLTLAGCPNDATDGGGVLDPTGGIKSDNEAETRSIQYTKTVRFLFEAANGKLTLGKGLVRGYPI